MAVIKERITESIRAGLPGTDVQWMMASSDRMLKDFPRVPGADARVAAVLILLFPDDNKICTVFMQRPDYTGIHGGQISFPGGKKEPGDESVIFTALREAFEETGIAPASVSVLGTLTPLFIPVSNMIVTPVVGWTESRPSFSHDPAEVVFLIEAPLGNFLDPSIIKTTPMMLRGEMIDVRYFGYKSHVIWGATAMMLNELLEIIKKNNIKLEIH